MRFKYSIFTLIVIFISVNISYGQDKELDSLKTVLENHKFQDTTRVILLNQFTQYYTLRDNSKNGALLNEAEALSEKLNYTAGIAMTYTSKAIFYAQSGELDEALKYALMANKLHDSLNDLDGVILSNSTIARVYTQRNEPQKAIDIQLENLKLLKTHLPSAPKIAGIHFYLGQAYQNIKQWDKAKYHFNEAKTLAESSNFETGVMIANSSLAIIEIKLGNYKQAIDYLLPALKFYERYNQDANIAHSNISIAEAYAGLKQYNKAIAANAKAIATYEKQNIYKNLVKAYKQQSSYYESLRNHKQSNLYLKKFITINDSILSETKQRTIDEMQVKYETEKIKSQKELAEQTAKINKLESQKQRSLFWIASIIAGLILIASLFYYSRAKAKRKTELALLELEETKKRLVIEQQYRESELKVLKSQMNPHFIFNALNSIQDYILNNEKSLARTFLVKFSRLIRMYLEHSQKSSITLEEELTALDLYLALEKVRFEDSLTYSVSVSENINSRQISIPSFLVQPYVENAIKHGLLHKKDDRKLAVNFQLNKDKSQLNIVIDDNGIGRAAANAINSKRVYKPASFSSDANLKRIELINKTRQNPITLTIIDKDLERNHNQGTQVNITIPL